MKLSIISGSGRPRSQSAKVGRYLEERAKESGFDDIFFLDLGENPLPLWTPEFQNSATSEGQSFKEILEHLEESQAFIIISPEWHGMATAIIKNFFLYFAGSTALDHKPGLAVAVSAGRGGAYPIAELRMSSYKNSHLCYIPEHLIVRDVENVLNSSSPENDGDEYIRKRSHFALRLLKEYAGALANVRDSGLNFSDYSNGM